MVQTLGEGQLCNNRLEILLASMVRSVNTSRAIRHLWTERPYAEEMGVLVRSLAEGIINATYLQIADPREVESFVQFDGVELSKTLGFFDELRPPTMPEIRTDLRSALDERVAAVQPEVREAMTKTSWTSRNLHDRAVAVDNFLNRQQDEVIDKATSTILMTFISRLVYRHGHTYTHATFSSLGPTIFSLRTGSYAEEDVWATAEHNLLITGHSLYAFALALALLKHLSMFDKTLDQVSRLLQMYNESVPINPSGELIR